jgi:ATP-dependent Clp protease ATP-binding subunit ClpX
MTTILSPKKIYEHLDKRVVGQEEAKRILSAAGFLHASKTLYWKKTYQEAPHIRSSNVLLMGPSGCGKTYMVQTMAEYLGMPYLEINARGLSNEGYKGMSISDHFEAFHKSYPAKDRSQLLHSVVFLDEFDKICGESGGSAGWNTSLQHSLLKVLEGGKVDFPNSDGPFSRQNKRNISTAHMLFVIGGNFQAVRDHIRRPKTIGFHDAEKPKIDIHEQLIKVGMIQEIAGRISLMAEVQQLSRKDLKRALTKAENNIYQQYRLLYQEMFSKQLKLSPYQLDKIVGICMNKKIGARGLQASLDQYMINMLFEEEIDLDEFLDDFLNRD